MTDYIVRETVDADFRRKLLMPIPTGQGVLCRDGAGDMHLILVDQELSWPKHSMKVSTYETVGTWIYRGSEIGTPMDIEAISGVDAGCTIDVRIYDVTNALTICEVLGDSGAYPAITALGTISNVPTGQAIWELQIRKDSGPGNSFVHAAGVSVRY